MHTISIIIPVYNEEDNIMPLCQELTEVMDQNSYQYEIICVNDGSKDRSLLKLKEQAARNPHLKIISFARNYGQTAAIAAGIHHAKNDVFIFMDSDLQNDPHDIPKLLAKLEEGYDVISGWRKDRKDNSLKRILPSRLANMLISKITRVPLHDYGCTLKAYRRRVIENVQLYGEMHRFIPAYASWYGAKVAEIEVHHRQRTAGISKYGLNRTFKVLLDLLFVKFWHSYLSKPMHFFGGIGFLALGAGFLAVLLALLLRFTLNISLIQTPLPLFSAFATIAGFQFILIGIIAEMILRVYFEAREPHAPYHIAETINIFSS